MCCPCSMILLLTCLVYFRGKNTIVAGWREFRENPLPSVGLIETTNGFVPFTGRRHQQHALFPAVISRRHSDTPINIHDNIRQQQPLNFDNGEIAQRQRPQVHLRRDRRLQPEETGSPLSVPDCSSRSVQRQHQLPPGFVQPNNPGGALAAAVERSEETSSAALRPDLEFPVSRNLASSPAGRDVHVPGAADAQVQISNMSHQSYNSPPRSPFSTSPPSSLFTIRPQDAVSLVRSVQKDDDSQHCYFIHLTLRPLFSDDVIPGTCLRKLPRLINGIPLGPGFLSNDQITEIKWRLIEGGHSILTFISCPLMRQEAEESKRRLKERLLKQAQAVFGDLTVNVGVVLSRCLDFDDDLTLNDIAVNFGEGLHFRD